MNSATYDGIPTMKLTSTRDTAIIGGAIATGLAAAYLMLDDLMTSPPWRTQPAGNSTKVPYGVHFDLYEVTADDTGVGRSRYVRPATELEAKSAEAAEMVDDGPGVFAVIEGGTHVLPGTPEWDALIAPAGFDTAPAKYYRVG